MDGVPPWKLHLIDDVPCWSIDWRDFFRAGVRCHNPFQGGEMRRFHVVFRLRIHESGTLQFWDDDGSIIRQNGEVVHEDRSAHPLSPHAIEVTAGSMIEVAQWQMGWDWLWCARIQTPGSGSPLKSHEYLRTYLPIVCEQLSYPSGPPLKMYTSGKVAIRTIGSLYSMVLNGYTPAGIILFGEEQWSERARSLFSEFLPFARIVPHSQAIFAIQQWGGAALAERARSRWYEMKAFMALAMPPEESCIMDDDVFVLDRMDEALDAFSRCDLVYIPDQDLTEGYIRTWGPHLGWRNTLRTGRFNAGLYWMRNVTEAGLLARAALETPSRWHAPFEWEQGLIAFAYADRPTHELPSQRYFYPLFDGLPGGIVGYDYRGNPCGFATIHYGGLEEKPSEALTIQLLGDLLERKRNVTVSVAKTSERF
jgi:hypothetical protein